MDRGTRTYVSSTALMMPHSCKGLAAHTPIHLYRLPGSLIHTGEVGIGRQGEFEALLKDEGTVIQRAKEFSEVAQLFRVDGETLCFCRLYRIH